MYNQNTVEIRIHLPRPLLTLGIIAAVALWYTGVISINLGGRLTGDATGGMRASAVIAEAMQDVNRERVRTAVLEKREEILRYQLQILEEANSRSGADAAMLSKAREALLAVIRERSVAEDMIKQSLEALWEAQGSSFTLRNIDIDTTLLWPVSPRLGISAHFNDEGYQKRFGIPHHAIDIPVPQGTEIQAPAQGTVASVHENGLGYSTVTLDHGDGVRTIYGHVSEIIVLEGQVVNAGDAIALSGGQPGTKGAGILTTGPHLHFAVSVDGVLVDPLKYLPKI